MAIIYASKNGHVQVLEWFKNSGYEFKYNKDAIMWASRNGHIEFLEWFKNSDYEFKYDIMAINTKFIKILKFFGYYINIKKLIKWSNLNVFIETTKFKTKNNYIKGYNKN